MPADATTAQQTSFAWKATHGLFKAEGIPIIPTDDAGRSNRYPLMRLTAADKTSSQNVATLDIVLPVSEETTCRDCHATGGPAAKGSSIAWSDQRRRRSPVARERPVAARQPHGHPPDGRETGPVRGLPLLRRARPGRHRACGRAGGPSDDVRGDARLSQRQDGDGCRRAAGGSLRCAGRFAAVAGDAGLLSLPSGQDHAMPARRDDRCRHLPELPRRHARGRRRHGPRGGRQHRRTERRQGATALDGPAALPVLPHRRRVESPDAGRRAR